MGEFTVRTGVRSLMWPQLNSTLQIPCFVTCLANLWGPEELSIVSRKCSKYHGVPLLTSAAPPALLLRPRELHS